MYRQQRYNAYPGWKKESPLHHPATRTESAEVHGAEYARVTLPGLSPCNLLL